VAEPIGLTASIIEIVVFGRKVLLKTRARWRGAPDERAFIEVVELSLGQVVTAVPQLTVAQQQLIYDSLRQLLSGADATAWLGIAPAVDWPESAASRLAGIPAEYRQTTRLLAQFNEVFWRNLKAHAARDGSPLHNLVALADLN
jgi:hypothetical protein